MHAWVPIVFLLGEMRVVDFFGIFIVLDVSPSSSQCVPNMFPIVSHFVPYALPQCCPPGSYIVRPIYQFMCFHVWGSVVVWSSSNFYENL